jgi:hypothetical protein
MNADKDKQDELQRVLALKRHEAPPSRFFTGFSGKVINRLHSPESPEVKTWWQRLGLDPDNKPVLICASGVIVCVLLGVGLIASLRVERPKAVRQSLDDQSRFVVAPPVSDMANPPAPAVPSAGSDAVPRVGSPVVLSPPSPFGSDKVQPTRATINSQPAQGTVGRN